MSFQDILALLPAALALTILIYADEILTARVFSAKHGQKMDANQEFIAIGMANIGAGFLTGFPAALSASRTAVSDQMGGKTQWVGTHRRCAHHHLPALFHTPAGAPAHRCAGGDHHRCFDRIDRHGRFPLLAEGEFQPSFGWRW